MCKSNKEFLLFLSVLAIIVGLLWIFVPNTPGEEYTSLIANGDEYAKLIIKFAATFLLVCALFAAPSIWDRNKEADKYFASKEDPAVEARRLKSAEKTRASRPCRPRRKKITVQVRADINDTLLQNYAEECFTIHLQNKLLYSTNVA